MNYIKHLNAVFQQFANDDRLNCTHISLYMALFQFWNLSRFSEVFYINREEVMKMSKLGSKTIYHRTLINLDNWSFITYYPTRNPFKSSQIKMTRFWTSCGTSCETSCETSCGTSCETSSETSSGQVVGQAKVSYINNNKHDINNNKPALPKKEKDVLSYFENQNWPKSEGIKFYAYYSSLGWKIKGKAKINNWHSLAKKWMLQAEEVKKSNSKLQKRDNLKTEKNKNYNEPL